MRITNKISLDFSRNTMPPVVQAKQGDVRSRYIEITPLDNGAKWAIPDGISAHFASRKPDGKHVYLDTPVIADGVITVELSDQTLVVAGRSVCDIILLSEDGRILTSQNFFLEVEYSPGAYAELESTDEVQSLYKLIDSIETKLANGEFNGAPGAPGYTPVKGVDYFDGEDGSRWFSGTAVSIDGALPVYLVSGAKEGDYYLNTTSGNVYRAGKTYWEYEGNIKGRAGDPGAPGTSVTHEWNGTVLTITSASGTSSADLQGPPGEGDAGGGADLSDSAPVMNGEASPGVSEEASRADHVHPTDTSRMPSVDQMVINTNPANADYIPVYSTADKDMKRVMWGRLLALVKAAITSVASAETAESLTDPASGYTAVLPELEGNAVLLLAADLAAHNVSEDVHNDIRLLIEGLANRINAVLDSDDATLDELSEIVAYIKANKALIDSITTSKVSVADIVNNLTTNVANKPLSAAQGVALKALIDAIKIPTKLSELTGDATHRTVTDAEKAAWDAKSNFSGAYADLTGKPTIPTVPTKLSAFSNDVGYIKQAELDAAVDDALAEAKESGEFDGAPGAPGKNGTSVTVSKVTESTEDGGENVVTFSDGKTVKIKNGSKGNTGPTGPQGPAYTLTEADKATITAMVIETLGGQPVFGYVDENNNIIVSGTLADGTYSVKYETDNGTIDIGYLVLDSNVYYSVTNNLTNCTNSNSATQAVEGGSYSATITANDGYELSSVVVTMGGTDISSSAVSGNAISIASVTGNIVITAVAEEVTTVEPTNFCVVNRTVGTTYYADTDPTSPSYGWISGGRCSSAGDNRTDSAITCVTNYIPVQNGDVIYVKNLNISPSVFSGVYKDGYTAMKGIAMTSTGAAGYMSNIDLSGEWEQFTIANADIKFIRICGIPEQITSAAGNKPFFDVVDIANLDIIVNIKRNGEWL